MSEMIRLSAVEFAGLAERVPVTVGINIVDGTYQIALEPIRFWLPKAEWERHLLKILFAKFSTGWKDVLTEPTLVKLRALLDPPKVEDAPQSGGALDARKEIEEC